jgi:ribonucleoside-diphosphate reductase alpha chain
MFAPEHTMQLCSLLTPQPICTDVLWEKYTQPHETSQEQVQQRVAQALATAEAPDQQAHWRAQFLRALKSGFIPAGRILSAAGTNRVATLMNCFVQPVADSMIHEALGEAVTTLRFGGGVGYDFSSIDPNKSVVNVLHRFDYAAETVSRTGARRGAQMGVLRCDHPDIGAFIHAKDAAGLHHFNLSVGITDAFMHALQHNVDFDLVYHNNVYRRISAAALWEQIMCAAYDHGEPGVLFLDTLNRDNNLFYCETLCATNPCAEQPLPPYGCCCLGTLDITRFIKQPFGGSASFDDVTFANTVHTAVRMLDNVLEITRWPLPQQQMEAQHKRRIGLGFTGLGDALVMLNLRYDSPAARAMAARIARCLRDSAYDASVELARERGSFPLLDRTAYLAGNHFASRLPAALRERIRRDGLRNSHLLSIAPAGSISLAFADNVSNGVEPVFGWDYMRNKRMPDGSHQRYQVQDHAWRLYQHQNRVHMPRTGAFITAWEVSPQAHIDMVSAITPYIDAGISKTVNIAANYPYADFKNLYLQAWKFGLKGLTSYRPNARFGSVLCAT